MADRDEKDSVDQKAENEDIKEKEMESKKEDDSGSLDDKKDSRDDEDDRERKHDRDRSRSRSRSRRRDKDDYRDDDDRDDDRDGKRDDRDRRRRDQSRSPSRSRDRSRRGGGRGGRGGSGGYGDEDPEYGRKLYIGNLDFRTDKHHLEDKFRKFGRIVDVFIPLDGRGDSRGFGFVTFEDKRDAEDAAHEMRDATIDGRRIECNIARPRPSGGRGGGGGGRDRDRGYGGGRGGGGGGANSTKIYIGNLPMDVREGELEKIFGKYGRITRIDLKTPSRPPAYAFIEYEDVRDAEDAVEAQNGTKFGRDTIRVEFSKPRRR
mmetsp:Transcript_17223/g.25840  ORF Transcript_17223/g.25840 Transcript_17223/m.25840 type:complete len:319 (-) Transcript_17223:312-1268(-)|eukprot:CAMPEP_0167744958 /NCGR_PEP_ID=MMETSP0110_2-20121227/2883_1 /TAXON_ID=629695 /ORGANISM="Gymnochlora sp., Strain CCMP2014" /LENGTH=318 /DNA_ID=CAMNT_0007629543 /DNA_START=582 /DNA_END=1538 /DNA_ORIENTATION=-